MSERTGIEWTDATWNPVTGCTEVSPGCDHCYARTFAERFAGAPGHYFERGFGVQLRPDKLGLPLRWRKPRRVFVNSMSDLFHANVPDEYIARVFAVMAVTPRHTYQVLTKRHGRMRSLLGSPDFAAKVAAQLREPPGAGRLVCPLPNVWLGVSVEDQKRAELRVPALLDTPAAVRFLSCEPLLGPVDLTAWLDCPHDACSGGYYTGRWTCDQCAATRSGFTGPFQRGLHWVIVGGESGRAARPMHPDWARSLRDQSMAAGVPFFFKQWGEYQPMEHGGRLRVRRVGKHNSGRVLDGRSWDQIPAIGQVRALTDFDTSGSTTNRG